MCSRMKVEITHNARRTGSGGPCVGGVRPSNEARELFFCPFSPLMYLLFFISYYFPFVLSDSDKDNRMGTGNEPGNEAGWGFTMAE